MAIRVDVPGVESLAIEDRMVPGRPGDPDVAVRVYRPAQAPPGRVPGGSARAGRAPGGPRSPRCRSSR